MQTSKEEIKNSKTLKKTMNPNKINGKILKNKFTKKI